MSKLEKEIKLLKSLTVTVEDVETFNVIACDENFTNEAVMWQPIDTEQIQDIQNSEDQATLTEVNNLFKQGKIDVALSYFSFLFGGHAPWQKKKE